ncbi:MAG: Nitroreductase family [Phormidesmis priestleyi Ana]|uniref:Nitroreductase family n=1 Tax=Phormidesmis priestleyi Ana TaxID=1666911 RepID=A0A0P7YVQ1_9CYAN|nr:MAG: Nitroreductase family [Phormidesmis priestleyi Ana]
MSHSEQSSADFSALKNALFAVKTLLKVLGQADGAQAEEIAAVFSHTVSFTRVQYLLKKFGKEDFSQLPKVAICSRARLNGVRSSYQAHTDTIYLAEDFLSAATELQLITALLEGLVDAIEAGSMTTATDSTTPNSTT